jgi:hypothetical protein
MRFRDLFHFLQIVTVFSDTAKGIERKTQLRVDPEDIIALVGALIAIIFTVAMVFGIVPINKYTTGIVSFSCIGAAVAAITKARNNKSKRTPWIERIAIVALLVVFGMYVWLSWGWVSATIIGMADETTMTMAVGNSPNDVSGEPQAMANANVNGAADGQR